jgi:predicted nucleic acid-binding protein
VIAETLTVLIRKIKELESFEEIYVNMLRNFIVISEDSYYNMAFKEFLDYNAKLPFFDTLYISIIKHLGIGEIASFDKQFDNKKGIIRVY